MAPSGVNKYLCLLFQLVVLLNKLARLQAVRDLKLSLGADFFNPSLVYYEGDYWVSLREARFENDSTVGQRWVNQVYLCFADNSELRDPQCRIYDPFEGHYKECLYNSTLGLPFRPRLETTGIEDLKLFNWPGRGLFGIFGRKVAPVENSTACPRPLLFRQFLVKVGSYTAAKWDDSWNLVVPVPLVAPFRHSRRVLKEKNWMPFVYNDDLYFTYSIQPHKVLQVDTNGTAVMRYLTSSPQLFANLPDNVGIKWSIHGGPPHVFVPANMSVWNENYYLGVFHYFHYSEGQPKQYRHFAFKMQPKPPFRVVARSSELSLQFVDNLSVDRIHASHVTYVNGLDMTPEGIIMISYGSADVEARVMMMPLHDLEAMFTDPSREVQLEFLLPNSTTS